MTGGATNTFVIRRKRRQIDINKDTKELALTYEQQMKKIKNRKKNQRKRQRKNKMKIDGDNEVKTEGMQVNGVVDGKKDSTKASAENAYKNLEEQKNNVKKYRAIYTKNVQISNVHVQNRPMNCWKIV